MAIFTYIATAIVTAIGSIAGVTLATAGVLTTAGTIATSLIAGGLGYITAKVTGVMKVPNIQASKDPGVKVQLSPSTDRRVPVFYGKIHTGGLIVDAQIKNQNNTMVYCMVIGEKTDAGAFTVQSIKRQDAKLNFSGANVISITDPNGTSTNNVANKMRCRVFAGNAQSSVNQIFPATNKVAAQTLMTTITAQTNYEDLVYAIFEIDYDAEEGLTTLGTITYEITNSLSEPSNVLLDYSRNSRYGAGLSNAQLDLNSFNDLYDYSNAQVAYTNSAGASANHSRWKIDGVLSTYQAVKDNIDQLCQSCSTFFTYDNKQGKFKVVPNRAATTAEKNAAFIFDDQNIITSIDITSTELYSLYNEVEVEYPSVAQQDQTKTIVISTPSGDRNTNEPDNNLGTRFNLVNDAPRVHNLANIDLRQSRISTTVSFSADYSALVVDVGDIVKVTNALYGFDSKLFRVMKVSEVESDGGYISAKVVLLEYADSVYVHNVVATDASLGLSGIPGWWTNLGNTNVTLGNTIITDPTTGTANIVNSANGNVVGNTDYGNIDWANISFGGIGGFGGTVIMPTTPVAIMDVTIPDVPGLDVIDIDINTSETGSPLYKSTTNATYPNPFGGTWAPNQRAFVALPLPDKPPAEDTTKILPNFPNVDNGLYNFKVGASGTTTGTGKYGINPVTIPDVVIDNKGVTDVAAVQDMGIGYSLDTADEYSLMPFAGPNGLNFTTASASTNTQLVFTQTMGGDVLVGSDISGTGVPTGALVTAFAEPSTITSNATMNVGSGATITIKNANATVIGLPGSFYTPATTTVLGGIDLGDFTNFNSIVPVGSLPVGGSVINYAQRASITYEEVHTANNEPTGNTILDVQESPILTTGFDSSIPPSISNDYKFPITKAQGLAAAIAVYGGTAPTNGKTYVPKVLVSQPMANSSLFASGGQKAGAVTTVEVARATKSDLYRDLR